MTSQLFAQPVSIFVGLGFPHDVKSVWGAYEALTEWTGNRGPMHVMAINVCRSALSGEADIEAARFAFESFARSRGILAPDALIDTVSRAGDEWLAA